MEDEHVGGQQENVRLNLQKQVRGGCEPPQLGAHERLSTRW